MYSGGESFLISGGFQFEILKPWMLSHLFKGSDWRECTHEVIEDEMVIKVTAEIGLYEQNMIFGQTFFS